MINQKLSFTQENIHQKSKKFFVPGIEELLKRLNYLKKFMKIKLLSIIGTRPQFIKSASIARASEKLKINHIIIGYRTTLFQKYVFFFYKGTWFK